MSENIKESVRALLTEIIDYAGLFPPSQLSMAEAVINYATYRNSNYNWMLGKFVVPAARPASRIAVRRAGGRGAGRDRASTESKIENTCNALPPNVKGYFEIPTDERLPDLISALAINGQRAKIRTGGITPETFPPIKTIIRFIRTCLAANVPFKATAGLHHPLRCYKPLTYDSNAPEGMMNGFLNLFLATGFARHGFKPALLEEILEDEFEESYDFDETGVWWRREHFLNNSQLARLRRQNIISFGSCSFEESIADLQEIGLL